LDLESRLLEVVASVQSGVFRFFARGCYLRRTARRDQTTQPWSKQLSRDPRPTSRTCRLQC